MEFKLSISMTQAAPQQQQASLMELVALMNSNFQLTSRQYKLEVFTMR